MSSLGFASGSVIQEFGYDDDVDEAVRAQIEEETGQELVDEDYRDIVDGADLFLDMKANLESDVSPCWVLVPGTRSPGYVTADVIKDAAETAGLMATTSVAVGAAWMGVKLTAKGPRR